MGLDHKTSDQRVSAIFDKKKRNHLIGFSKYLSIHAKHKGANQRRGIYKHQTKSVSKGVGGPQDESELCRQWAAAGLKKLQEASASSTAYAIGSN